MLFRSREVDRAFEFVTKSDFDIFCLQEVPEEMLRRLKATSYHVAYVIDVERIFPKQTFLGYNVILSKYPIAHDVRIPFRDYQDLLPFRSKITVRLLRSMHFSKIRNRNGIYADISTPRGVIRIFCLHLILGHPKWRMEELQTAFTHLDPTRPTIVCGDFNILSWLHVTPINWLFAGKLSDVFLFTRERRAVESFFAAHGLTNALLGHVTHPFSRSQLDHILVSKDFSIKKADVMKDSYGSDHYPIKTETKP